MATVKLKIDLGQGILEVDGSEEFVSTLYNDFKARLNTAAVQPVQTGAAGISSPNPPAASKAASKPNQGGSKSKPRSKLTPTIVKDLDLTGPGKGGRLKDFYATFEPTTNMERNLIFMYYLQHKRGLAGITVDHVFTCYRDVPGVKAPEALRQSLLDTANRRGWLDTSDTENVQVTIPGVNYLEHDMPRKSAA